MKSGNQALKALMIFCCSLMSADVAPEAPPSRAPQVILHPVLSEPGWVQLLQQITEWTVLGLFYLWRNEGSALYTSALGRLLIPCVLSSSRRLASRPCPWSEASSGSAEHRHLCDDFNVKPVMVDTRRIIFDWPLVYATLGMPTGFPTALWRTRWGGVGRSSFLTRILIRLGSQSITRNRARVPPFTDKCSIGMKYMPSFEIGMV